MTWALQNSTLYLPTLVLSPSEKQQRFCLASGGKVPELHTEWRHDRQSRDKSGFAVSLVLCFNQLVTIWTEIVGSRRSSVWTTLWLCSRNVIPVISLLCISISHLEAISLSLLSSPWTSTPFSQCYLSANLPRPTIFQKSTVSSDPSILEFYLSKMKSRTT